MKKTVSLVAQAAHAKRAFIMLRGDGEEKFTLRAGCGFPRGLKSTTAVPPEEKRGVIGWVARNGRPLLIKDFGRDRRFSPAAPSGRYFKGATSLICLPLKCGGRVEGILAVNQGCKGNRFSAGDLEWLSVIARQASLALDTALAHRRMSVERDRRMLINELAASLMTTLAPRPLMSKILRSVCRLLKARGASLLLYDPERDELCFTTAVGPQAKNLENMIVRPGQGLAGWVLVHRKPVLVKDARRDRRFWSAGDALTGLTTTSVMAIPLASRGKAIGVLEVINRRDGEVFSEGDLEFMEMMAVVISVALENSFLYHRLADFSRGLERTVRERTRDLTASYREMKSTLKEIESLKRFNEQIIDNLNSGLITIDGQGMITYINPPAREILKIPESSTPTPLRQVFGERFARNLISDLKSRKTAHVRDEVKWSDPEGGGKILGYTVSPMKSSPGARPGWIMLFRDLTEAKMLETEMSRLDRLVSLGEVSANVAHELKNPLTVMYANMHYLLEKVPRGQQHRVQIVIDHMERMEAIIGRMGFLSRDTSLVKKPLDLRELISQLLLFLEKTFRQRKVEIVCALPPRSLCTRGDSAQLQQALLNIFMNAVQAMDGGGSLTVRLRRETRAPRATASIMVADSGPGIPPPVIKKIFEPFFTTKGAGTGLGLSITHRIITAHGGRMRAVNRPGGGAVFHVTLPLFTPDVAGKGA